MGLMIYLGIFFTHNLKSASNRILRHISYKKFVHEVHKPDFYCHLLQSFSTPWFSWCPLVYFKCIWTRFVLAPLSDKFTPCFQLYAWSRELQRFSILTKNFLNAKTRIKFWWDRECGNVLPPFKVCGPRVHDSVCLSVCLSVVLSACLSVCLAVCLPGWLTVCLSVCLLACLFVCLTGWLAK